jgi:hypothetical protein
MLNWPRMEQTHFLHKKFGGNRVPHMMGYQIHQSERRSAGCDYGEK